MNTNTNINNNTQLVRSIIQEKIKNNGRVHKNAVIQEISCRVPMAILHTFAIEFGWETQDAKENIHNGAKAIYRATMKTISRDFEVKDGWISKKDIKQKRRPPKFQHDEKIAIGDIIESSRMTISEVAKYLEKNQIIVNDSKRGPWKVCNQVLYNICKEQDIKLKKGRPSKEIKGISFDRQRGQWRVKFQGKTIARCNSFNEAIEINNNVRS